MTDAPEEQEPERPESEKVPVVPLGPDGEPISDGDDGTATADDQSGDLTDLVEQPAKVMRIGSMIKQLLEEVREAPLDQASRGQLREIHDRSVAELKDGLAPELVSELERLSLPFVADSEPSESELRIAQAQLVGWLEGLFHGIQTAMVAQQMSARAAMEAVQRRAIGGGSPADGPGATGQGGRQQPSGPYL